MHCKPYDIVGGPFEASLENCFGLFPSCAEDGEKSTRRFLATLLPRVSLWDLKTQDRSAGSPPLLQELLGTPSRSTLERKRGQNLGSPAAFAVSPSAAHFAHSLWTADKLIWIAIFFQLLFQVIPSWILLLIFFKAGLCTLWSQLQFHPSFCLIISGRSMCSLPMHHWYGPTVHSYKVEMFAF